MGDRDWREAARGIPVWEGAAIIGRDRLFVVDVAVSASVEGWVEVAGARGARGHAPPGDAVPDLSDPDTRAAYDRRLALALGAPLEQADAGATFYYSRIQEKWEIAAGNGSWGIALKVCEGDPSAPLLARALAWPADKRTSNR